MRLGAARRLAVVGAACAARASTGRWTGTALRQGADPLNERPNAPPSHACMRCCSRVCPCMRSSAICPFAHVAPRDSAPCSCATAPTLPALGLINEG
ncbi:hypothetical protein T484DRAFT_1969349 [Baffinella frigidus]|nr:hypothetical protein T484DRAFT_1969349 [Cryptophyta sp. CCMP2293]